MMIIGYFTIWMLIICYSIVVQCFPTAHHVTTPRPHPELRFHTLPFARHPPTPAPMLPPIPVVYGPMPFYHHPPLPPPLMVQRPAIRRADNVLPPSQMMKHRAADMPYPAFAPPVMQPPMMMQHPRMQPMMVGAAPMMTPRPQMQPMMVGPAPMMGAPYMMQQPPMVGQSLYPFPTNQQYDDYDKKDDEDDEDEYVKPLKVGQVGLSFGIKGVHEPGATGESGATTQFPLGDMLSGMMGGVAKIVQADAQKEMMGNMMKMMMLSSLVDM